MSHRPLVLVSGLTVGDYVLWNWSLNANHSVIALISGLTLPPLAVAALWLLALSVARLLASTARRPAVRRNAGAKARPAPRARRSAGAVAMEESAAQSQDAAPSSGKLAA